MNSDKSRMAGLLLLFACISWLIPLFVGNILAIIFGCRALKEIRINPGIKGRGMAWWGISLGLISIPMEFLFAVFLFRLLYPGGGH